VRRRSGTVGGGRPDGPDGGGRRRGRAREQRITAEDCAGSSCSSPRRSSRGVRPPSAADAPRRGSSRCSMRRRPGAGRASPPVVRRRGPSYYQPFKVLRHKYSPDKTSLRVTAGAGASPRARTSSHGPRSRLLRRQPRGVGPARLRRLRHHRSRDRLRRLRGPRREREGRAGLRPRAGGDARGQPLGRRGPDAARHVRLQARAAERHGAAALLVMPEPQASHRSFWRSMTVGGLERRPAPVARRAGDQDPVLYVRGRVGGTS